MMSFRCCHFMEGYALKSKTPRFFVAVSPFPALRNGDAAKTLHYSAFSASSAGDKISLKSKTPHLYK